MRIQRSYGIACFRKKKEYEFLFINKRLTYAYISFVKGIYGNLNYNDIKKLLNKMTVEEKITIKSLDFRIIWYKCYLSFSEKGDTKTINLYKKCKRKYDTNFMKDDGLLLLELINMSISIELIWEIPKGHKDLNELEMNTAVREFFEETNISKYKYKLLFNIKPMIYSFIDSNVKYVYTYYIAQLLDTSYTPYIKLNIKTVIYETTNIKFLSLNEIKCLSNDKQLIYLIKNLIKLLKKY